MSASPDNPMERLINDALTARGTKFSTDPRDTHGLDFRLQDTTVHIETKQFHAGRIAEQMSRVDNVIVAQGREAVTWLADAIAPAAPTWPRHRLRIDLAGVSATAIDFLKGTEHPLRGAPTEDDKEGHAALFEQLIEHIAAVRSGTASLADFADFYGITPPRGAAA